MRMLIRSCDQFGINIWLRLCVLLTTISISTTVDRGNFKTCDQSFCKRHRAGPADPNRYVGLVDTVKVASSGVELNIQNRENNVVLRLSLTSLDDSTLRLKINEQNPIRPRFEIPLGDVLVEEPKLSSFELLSKDSSQTVVKTATENKIVIHMSPLRIDVIGADGTPVISVNARGLLKFEHLREKGSDDAKKDGGEEEEKKEGEGEEDENEDKKEEVKPEEGLWEETFKTHQDSKPNGPATIGVDFSFPGYEFVYGIPEHADTLALRSTKSTDPYRLYNLDVFEYEIGNTMALYGSVPVMLAHNTKRTVGLFWNNAAETWVDIASNTADKNMFSKLVDFVKGGDEIPQIDTQWISESGIIDVFLMLGPKPADVFRQYAKLTGTTPLPPLFGMAYHQSRWNYNDEQDVANLDAGFDEHDIPLDVIWLDIEHTDGKRYFTWDEHKFPRPAEMLHNISAKGRKMVTIVDPHIKRDDNYHVYREAKERGYLIKTKDGGDLEGWCWPGSSAWLDFLDPTIRRFWAEKFLPSQYTGSTHDLFIWNDMNEPSVFSGPEVTMVKDAKHFGGWEHRDVHNLYGLYVHRSTAEGLELRSGGEHRPFVLSRAFFAGTQRYGAVWTGDNTGEWSHLKMSLPMILSLNLVGITFSGADIGGFFKNPDPELLTRWYQAAAFQPFFRAHAHLDTRRREPWLLPEENMKIIRNAIRLRYRMLPFWYTLFYNAEIHGGPIVKPLWVDFPEDKSTFAMEDVHLVGSAILVRPIVEQGSVGTNVYLPGPNDVWYDADTYQAYKGGVTVYIPVDLNKIPVFLRGGYIVPIRERIRRASILSANDPYSLIISLDPTGKAFGELYHDDFFSFQYRQGKYIHRRFAFTNRTLTSTSLNKRQIESTAWLEKIIVIGLEGRPQFVALSSTGLSRSPVNLESTYDATKKILVIRKPAIGITVDFAITLN